MQQRPAQPPATRRPQTSGATQRCLNPGFSERIGNSRRTGVKYVKRNALAGRRFPHWAALEAWLEEWTATVADRRVHGTTHERPIASRAKP